MAVFALIEISGSVMDLSKIRCTAFVILGLKRLGVKIVLTSQTGAVKNKGNF